jgi:two-component system, chemotaxis family, CheB/CheR fusion protein
VLVALIERMHENGAKVEQEFEGPNNRFYLIRVLPYRAQTGQVGGAVLTFVDITAVKEAKQELGTSRHRLQESEQRFQAVLDYSTAGIFVKDLDGRYTLVNRQFAVLLNGEPASFLGKTDRDLFSESKAQLRRECDRRVLEGEPAVEVEEVFSLADGPHTFLSIRFPLRDAQNKIYAIAGIATDITDRKRIEIESREALARRDQFLAMLSHELRNPLGAIQNATQVLGRSTPEESLHQEACQVIERQTGQMARLLDDLLDVTRIAQNRIRLQKSVIDLRDIAREAAQVVESQARAAGVNLVMDAGSEPQPVFGDGARLQQMLVNLLMNAVKYTPSSGNVWLTLAPEGEHIAIHVKDTGVGIRPAMLEKVFELFVQANETLHRSEGGLGVGLTLVRTIAEMHGGSVRAFSEGPGKGSEFVVRLPRSEGREANVEDSPIARPSPATTRPSSVLIIEDNADSRRMLEAMLRLDGYIVHTAGDGKQGLDAIRRLRPHFAIIDIGLPEMNGYQIARQIRAEDWGNEPYLIALTGYGRPEDRRAVQDAGFDAHLVKPLKPDELARVLATRPVAER